MSTFTVQGKDHKGREVTLHGYQFQRPECGHTTQSVVTFSEQDVAAAQERWAAANTLCYTCHGIRPPRPA